MTFHDVTARTFEILQIEDTPTDILLTAEALKTCGIPISIRVVMNGRDALSFLKHQDAYTEAPRPDLVLLDFSLPGLDGDAVLLFIKQDPELRTIPVVVFSSMDSDECRQKAYQLSANSYVVKPTNLDAFRETVQSMVTYWLRTVSPAAKAA
jgi:CheY-like chemotaxis protein